MLLALLWLCITVESNGFRFDAGDRRRVGVEDDGLGLGHGADVLAQAVAKCVLVAHVLLAVFVRDSGWLLGCCGGLSAHKCEALCKCLREIHSISHAGILWL